MSLTAAREVVPACPMTSTCRLSLPASHTRAAFSLTGARALAAHQRFLPISAPSATTCALGRWRSAGSGSASSTRLRRRTLCATGGTSPAGGAGSNGDDDADDQPPPTIRNALETTIRRKQVQVESQLKELGNEALEERLQSSVQMPAKPAYRLSRLIADYAELGKAVLVYEVCRGASVSSSDGLAALAKRYVEMGADVLSVRMDAEDTPQAFKDLWAVTRAVKVPVIARDWLIHPLQIVEAKEAGASGVLGVIHQVNGRGTALMSSFSAAVGMDAPVEVVNTQEVQALTKAGVVFYGINLSVGLSIAVPGFAKAMAHGLLGELPFGAVSLVGVRSVEDARTARASGADALFIKQELIAQHSDNPAQLFDMLAYIVSGDD